MCFVSCCFVGCYSAFQKAESDLEPLSSLDLAPLNLQPSTTLDSVYVALVNLSACHQPVAHFLSFSAVSRAFKDLTLSGLDDALPLSSVLAVYVASDIIRGYSILLVHYLFVIWPVDPSPTAISTPFQSN